MLDSKPLDTNRSARVWGIFLPLPVDELELLYKFKQMREFERVARKSLHLNILACPINQSLK